MHNLERRVTELEKANPATEGKVIVIHAVSPGELEDEINYLRAEGGQHWMRGPQETEQAFRARAYGEAPYDPYGIAVLFTFD